MGVRKEEIQNFPPPPEPPRPNSVFPHRNIHHAAVWQQGYCLNKKLVLKAQERIMQNVEINNHSEKLLKPGSTLETIPKMITLHFFHIPHGAQSPMLSKSF